MNTGLHQIVTFAAHPFAGNPAWVVTADGMPDASDLSRIAAQLREGVLAVLDRTGSSGHAPLSFVTASGVHKGAGHAAHAAAVVALRRIWPDIAEGQFALPGGRALPFRRTAHGVAVDWPRMGMTANDRRAEVKAIVGRMPEATFATEFGLMAVMAGPDEVEEAAANFDGVSMLPDDALVLTSPGARSDFAIRVFAPKLGLPEDPVCGTAHRFVAPYWAEKLGRGNLLSHQLSPRGGEIWCTVRDDIVTLAGAAVTFVEGQLFARVA
jgi:predicted PhzF superfamily epimerase YddE/YHI9